MTDLTAALVRTAARRRRSAVLTPLLAAAAFVALYLLFRAHPALFGLDGSHPAAAHVGMVLLALAPALAVWHYAPGWLERAARRGYADHVLAPIGKEIDPAMTYDPAAHITRAELDASLLFDSAGEGTTTLQGGHRFAGEAAGAAFAFSTLDADKEIRHGCHLFGGTMFSGLFLRLDPARPEKGLMLAVPRASGITPDAVAERLAALDRQADGPVRPVEVVHDPEFDRWFAVYADGPGAAHAPTPAARRKMLDLLNRHACQPYWSRVDGVVCLALQTGRAHLEPPAARPDDVPALRAAADAARRDIALLRSLAADPVWR